jgi:hypothetical protein
MGGICSGILNPISRLSCNCTVASGGVARMMPNNQVGWSSPRSGAAYHTYQQCMGNP